MKTRYNMSVALISSFLVSTISHAQIVLKPDARQTALTAAEAMLLIKPASFPADAVDPFNSAAFSEAMGLTRPSNKEIVQAGPRTDHDILSAIGAQLKPTGNFILNGQETLIFGQKRVKAGMPMTINFEGTEYTIEITAIDRTSFTLRLNREELTRPIK